MRLMSKETICRGQMVLKGNAARWAANPPPLRRRNGPPPLERADIGLGPWTHCLFEHKGEARVLVIRPLQGRKQGASASADSEVAYAVAGDQPQGWWWVRRRSTRRRLPFRTGPWGTWSHRPEKTPRPQRRRGLPKASPTRPPRGLCSPATDATNRSILVPWSKGERTRGRG